MKFTLISVMLLTAMAGVASVNAADYKKNPFTLVYDGAITENVKGKVNIYLGKVTLSPFGSRRRRIQKQTGQAAARLHTRRSCQVQR